MSKNKFKIGFLIYTYNRIDDAKINLEILHYIWKRSGLFSDIKVVHSYNGEKLWYPKRYLEDELLSLRNPGHFRGAAELIDAGIKIFQEKFSFLDYVIVLAADTWIVKPHYVNEILKEMQAKKLYWATCSWFSLPDKPASLKSGPAVDYFILDFKWVSKCGMFPLDYNDFFQRFGDYYYSRGEPVTLEAVLLARFFRAIHKEFKNDAELGPIGMSKIYVMKDREPVHTRINTQGLWIRRMYWSKMGLLTYHNPEPKRKILKRLDINEGENIKRLLTSKSLSYFNRGFITYQKGN